MGYLSIKDLQWVAVRNFGVFAYHSLSLVCFLCLTIVYLLFHQSQLAAVRHRHGSQAVFTRNRFRIRRDHILEDAYNQMSQLSEDDLRGVVMYFLRPILSFINHSLLTDL